MTQVFIICALFFSTYTFGISTINIDMNQQFSSGKKTPAYYKKTIEGKVVFDSKKNLTIRSTDNKVWYIDLNLMEKFKGLVNSNVKATVVYHIQNSHYIVVRVDSIAKKRTL